MTQNPTKIILQHEHWVQKGDARLYVFRKHAEDMAEGAPVLFLVHGSSLCARTGFDLEVPGKPGFSMMDWFAARGFDDADIAKVMGGNFMRVFDAVLG